MANNSEPDPKEDLVKAGLFVVITVVAIGLIVLFSQGSSSTTNPSTYPQSSGVKTNPSKDSTKYTECIRDAGEQYDSSRKTITKNENGYSKAEQDVFYGTNEDVYAIQLDGCEKKYN